MRLLGAFVSVFALLSNSKLKKPSPLVIHHVIDSHNKFVKILEDFLIKINMIVNIKFLYNPK